ncbi:MAG: hypothetical protein HUK19_08605, partial [Fibrobacter sp.]|nr:hypothetical protein [Fibrobacter sp.]
MSLLNNLRNKAVETFVRNHELVKKFGEVQTISVDSDNGIIDATVLLNGEQAPIKFRAYYYWDDVEKGTDIVIRKITSERQWIDTALDFALGDKT